MLMTLICLYGFVFLMARIWLRDVRSQTVPFLCFNLTCYEYKWSMALMATAAADTVCAVQTCNGKTLSELCA